MLSFPQRSHEMLGSKCESAGCATTLEREDDGLWRTSCLTGSLTSGTTELFVRKSDAPFRGRTEPGVSSGFRTAAAVTLGESMEDLVRVWLDGRFLSPITILGMLWSEESARLDRVVAEPVGRGRDWELRGRSGIISLADL